MTRYLFFLIIFLIPIGSAFASSTFTSSNPTLDGELQDGDNDDNCESVPSAFLWLNSQLQAGKYTNAAAFDCGRSLVEFTLTIPFGSIIYDVDFTFQNNAGTNPVNCDYVALTSRPSTNSNATNWAAISNGDVLVNNDATCIAAGNNHNVDLGSTADTYVRDNLILGYAAIGIKTDTDIGATDGLNHISVFCAEEAACTPDPTLTVIYSFTGTTMTLTSADIRGTGVDLTWTTPTITGSLPVEGYLIAYTTPTGTPTTVLVNDTGNTITSYTVSGLTGRTAYSFQVGAWVAGRGINTTSNIYNFTTDIDPTSSFTPGTFNLTGSGTDSRSIKYARDDISDTSLFLNVTADNDFELACNFHYKFANTNNTYTNIANTSINANEDMASFQFNNVNNEIIDVLCWDQYTNASAKYLITITDFPLLDQIADFRAGEFGTSGNFGAIDLITLLVVIISLVGFNRVDETVGIAFGLFVVGGLAVLSAGEILAWETTYTAAFAVLVMFGIAIVRKG